ncbi:MAG: COG1361 S-layer family protein [Candidatus Njordarchaeales archaeon]
MSTRVKASIILFCLLFYVTFYAGVSGSGYSIARVSASSVEFRVEDVFWGTLGNRITPSAGMINVPLTIVVRNYSNNTLRGVIGTLNLTYPFTDYQTGSNQSRARAEPIEQESVFNQTGDILPMGSFALTFYLNIDDNATKGEYLCLLKIEYSIKNGSFFIIGQPKIIEVSISLPNHPPTVESYSPSQTTLTLSIGSSVNFTVEASDQDNDSLTYEWELNGEIVAKGTNYTFVATENYTGSNTLVCTIDDGEATTSITWTIIVQSISSTKLWVSTQYIVAGMENKLTIKIRNDEWTGTVTATFMAMQPLVIMGNNTFTFENINPGDTVSFNITLYAPDTALGATTQCTVSITYNNENGELFTENLAIGLIIRGMITIMIYDIEIDPQPVSPGEKITITGVILNRGNVKAQFVNVSIVPSSLLSLFAGSFEYIGDLDPNSPTPFTIYAYLREDVKNGTYSIRITVDYLDDIYEPHTYVKELSFTVIEKSTESSQTEGQQSFTIVQYGWVIVLLVAVTAMSILYLRGRKHV